MCCDDCVNRREFLTIAAGSAALTVLASCSEPATSIPTPPRHSIKVGDYAGLSTIGFLVKVGPTHAVKRTGADTFQAFSMFCTHAGCATSLNGQQFSCPCHGSQFDANGAAIQGPATAPLATLGTSYNAATDTLTIN
jgi:cytochrome b6-f complex iron-sulfur subunit